MLAVIALLIAPPIHDAPPPPPLEHRVSDLERRVELLERAGRPDPMPKVDYDARYADAFERVMRGDAVMLAVGVPAPLAYETICELPSGYKDIPDGVYSCWREGDRAMMRRLPTRPTTPEVVVQRPFPLTPITPATSVAANRRGINVGSGSGIFYPTAGTFTGAPGAGMAGSTNCPTGFP